MVGPLPVDPVTNPDQLPPEAFSPVPRDPGPTIADVGRVLGDSGPARPSPKQLRQLELDTATRELLALLEKYDAQLLTEMVMGVGENGGPRYRFVVTVVPR